MLKVKAMDSIADMGFKEKDGDYYCAVLDPNGEKRVAFRIYRGSPYIRHSKTGYINEEQIKKIYEWTKKDYIEWEE